MSYILLLLSTSCLLSLALSLSLSQADCKLIKKPVRSLVAAEVVDGRGVQWYGEWGRRVRCAASSSSSSSQESREINFWLCLINIAPDPGSGCGFVLLVLVSSSIGRPVPFCVCRCCLPMSKPRFHSLEFWVWAIFLRFPQLKLKHSSENRQKKKKTCPTPPTLLLSLFFIYFCCCCCYSVRFIDLFSARSLVVIFYYTFLLAIVVVAHVACTVEP